MILALFSRSVNDEFHVFSVFFYQFAAFSFFHEMPHSRPFMADPAWLPHDFRAAVRRIFGLQSGHSFRYTKYVV